MRFPLLSLYITYVRVKASAGKAAWPLRCCLPAILPHPEIKQTGFAIKYSIRSKQCLPSRLLHFTYANIVPSAPSGFSAPRSQSSSGLAALCFCVQMDETQIPDSHNPRMVIPRDSIYSGVYVRHRFPGMIQHKSLRIPRHYLLEYFQNPPTPRRRFMRTCPLSRRPVSEDMAQTTGKQGAELGKGLPPVLARRSRPFPMT